MAKGCQHEPAVEMGCPGDPQAPDVGQAEHVPHKVSTAMERHWLGSLASHLPGSQAPSSEGAGPPGSPSACFKAAHLHDSLKCQSWAPYGLAHRASASSLTPSVCLLPWPPRVPPPQLGLACFSALCRPPRPAAGPNSLALSFHNHQTLLRSKGTTALPSQAPWPPTFCVT